MPGSDPRSPMARGEDSADLPQTVVLLFSKTSGYSRMTTIVVTARE